MRPPRLISLLALSALFATTGSAQNPAPQPRVPTAGPLAPPSVRRAPAVQVPQTPVTFTPRAVAAPAQPAVTARPNALQFDAKEKVVQVKSGETKAEFTYAVTNTSSDEITVLSVHTSCGCTAAKLPTHPNPWVLKPGEGGEIGATMDVTGKYGTVTKTVTVVSSTGSYPLLAKAVLPAEAFAQMQRMTERSRNLQIAAADRQAVFRGNCADCHVTPAVGKTGKELYNTACGICHEAEHRGTMVPLLRDREGTFTRDYWVGWIRNGKEGTLMPAFDSRKGGPLTDEQMESLADYLSRDFPLESPLPAQLAPGTAPAL